MRTTLHIDDDIVDAVKTYAEKRSVGMGRAVSELVRRGLTTAPATRIVNGLHVFDLPHDSPTVTSERVKELDSEQDR